MSYRQQSQQSPASAATVRVFTRPERWTSRRRSRSGVVRRGKPRGDRHGSWAARQVSNLHEYVNENRVEW